MRVRGADSISHSAVENPCLTLQLAPVFKVPQPQIQPAMRHVVLGDMFSQKTHVQVRVWVRGVPGLGQSRVQTERPYSSEAPRL